jgi:plastocyanin
VCGFSCRTGFADCDGSPGDGCEVSLTSDPLHCGGCDVACNDSNGAAGCASGSCTISCNSGYGNCDGDASNGCECVLVNGCNSTTALDRTGQSQVTIAFGGQLGNSYQPPCVRISAGSTVVFSGTFKAQPLAGGEVVAGVGTPDPSSPIPAVNSGMSASVSLGAAGTYPFFCPARVDQGMFGAIFVVP